MSDRTRTSAERGSEEHQALADGVVATGPEGLAGEGGDLTLDGNHWNYLDKPPLTLKGNWSRVENFILDHDHIRIEEYESSDEGKSWTKNNSGTEERTIP